MIAQTLVATALSEQLCLPHGPLAPVAARFLNRNNRGLIERGLDALEIQHGHRALDVGFGGGLSLRLMIDRVGDGQVAGIDPSPQMVARARRLYARHVRVGRIDLRTGGADAVPFAGEHFDRILSTQTVYFWDDVMGGLKELHRVLARGGRLALGVMPLEMQESFGFAQRGHNVVSHCELGEQMQECGFSGVEAPAGNRWVLVGRKA